MKKALLSLAAVILLMNVLSAQSTWTFDKTHTTVEFSVMHLVITEVTGEFKSFDGKVVAGTEDFSNSDIEFTAAVNSITTGTEMRDNHLKSDDFFNAEQFPNLKFKGKLVKNGSKYQLQGDFTIRDVTKTVTFDVVYRGTVKDPYGNTKAGFKITGEINRLDYNLKYNPVMESSGAVVGHEVTIICNVELQKQG